jgi:hypothetical protein
MRVRDLVSLSARPLDDVLVDVFGKYDMERLGGRSGRGWSSFAAFQRCPYYYRTRYLDGRRGSPSRALETGSVFHTFLALHYTWMMDEGLQLTPHVCRQELLDGGANGDNVSAGWRLYEAYADRYVNDYFYPLAVEHRVADPAGNSCRYDLIAKIETAQVGLPPGTWIVEHKTTGRFDTAALDGWQNDGEILGQIAVWKRARLDRRFGRLQGVIVNIVGKQKTPRFHRTPVAVQRWHVRQHAKDLKVWDAFQQICKATNTWPRSRANCITRWGLCEMFDHCAENQKPGKIADTTASDAITGVTGAMSAIANATGGR